MIFFVRVTSKETETITLQFLVRERERDRQSNRNSTLTKDHTINFLRVISLYKYYKKKMFIRVE